MNKKIFTYMLGLLMLPLTVWGQSAHSDIIETPGYTYTSYIDYINYMGSGIINLDPSNSIEVASFTIRDGGFAIDPDGTPTILDELALDFSHPEFIYAIAIFDGPMLVSQRYQDPTFPDSLMFRNLNLQAPDNGTKTFTVRMVFTEDVVDRERMVFTIMEANESPAGSLFVTADAGGASTANTNGINVVQVTATKFAFTVQPSKTAYKGMKLAMYPVVTAMDANAVSDKDYNQVITLANTAGLAMEQNSVAALEGQATFNNLIFTEKGVTRLKTTNSSGMTDATSREITIINTPMKKWDGGAGSNSWFDAENWYPNGLPDDGDNVVLDNQYVLSQYSVVMDQIVRQDVKTLTITPGIGKKITLRIPATNLSDTALHVIGEPGMNAVTLNMGGDVRNESVVDNGNYAFAISNGTFAIRNGGCYIHASNTPHRDLAMKLSTAFGTEKGIFKLDVPLTGDYEVFADGAIYGTLSIQATLALPEYKTVNSGTMIVRGDLEVLPLAEFYPTLDSIIIKGNLLAGSIFDPAVGTWVVMNGDAAQLITGNGKNHIDNLEIRNSSVDGVTLGQPLDIDNTIGAEFKLTNGRLFTSTTNLLSIPENATVSGGNLFSFVHGPMRKTVNSTDRVILPVGKDTFYRIIALVPTSADMTTFQTEYFNINPHLLGYDTASRDTILKRVSGVEYWSLTRSADATPADAYVQLTWSTMSGVTPGYESQIRVAHWNGQLWESKGGNPIDGTAERGYVTSDPEVSSFGIFTIGSLTRVNPLPVELISFTGELVHRDAELNWATAMEENNRGFAVERSFDGESWEQIGWKDGHGTHMGELQYNYIDMDVVALGHEVAYYRLKQVDYNGQYAYSHVVSVRMEAEQVAVQKAWINSHEDKLYFNVDASNDGNVNVLITDVVGRVVFNQQVMVNSGTGEVSVYVPNLPEGVNIVQIESNGSSFAQKVYNSR